MSMPELFVTEDWTCPACGNVQEDEIRGEPPEGAYAACNQCFMWFRVFHLDGITTSVEITDGPWFPERLAQGDAATQTEEDMLADLYVDFMENGVAGALGLSWPDYLSYRFSEVLAGYPEDRGNR
jgi:hypothetical protein